MPHLKTLWHAHSRRRLVEPFCGGLAITLGLRPRRALLNDANPHLINFYRWLQKGLVIDLEMHNDETLFYRHRDQFNQLLADGDAGTREAAEFFYYLNRTGYNGLCRFNRTGRFNVPFGRYSRIAYTRDFSDYRGVLAGWTFTSTDVESVPLDSGDFVYADPPYDVEFRSYAKNGFDWEHQERTAVWLARHRGPCVLMNQATPRIEKLYRGLGYQVQFLDAPRRISCNGDRTPAKEILAARNV